MRELPETFAASLATGATTLCRCWEIVRRDGVALGFTDHDRDVAFEGKTFRAESGFEASTIERAVGLAVDVHSVSGALRSDAIDEADLERGLYDSADVTLWIVDWSSPDDRLLVNRARIGEVRHQGRYFEAELVGLSERLNQPFGRAFLHSCDASLGDARCGADLTATAWQATATVTAVQGPQQFELSGIEGFASDFFAHGSASWRSGANAGLTARVKHHRASAAPTIELWQAPPMTVAVGDTLDLVAGCDKRAETCRAKFQNFTNFRGFPHIPGDDWAAGYPQDGGAHDGGSLFRS